MLIHACDIIGNTCRGPTFKKQSSEQYFSYIRDENKFTDNKHAAIETALRTEV